MVRSPKFYCKKCDREIEHLYCKSPLGLRKGLRCIGCRDVKYGELIPPMELLITLQELKDKISDNRILIFFIITLLFIVIGLLVTYLAR